MYTNDNCKKCVFESVCEELWEIYLDPVLFICSCCVGDPDDMSECTNTKCIYNAFLNGKFCNPRDISKALQFYCLECQEGSSSKVENCGEKDCPLHPFRLNPLFDGPCFRPTEKISDDSKCECCLMSLAGNTHEVSNLSF